jgi:hypothetical protein
MTPQEKAKELVSKFESVDLDLHGCEHQKIFGNIAIDCALIAFELILDRMFWEDDSYFTEVKNELLKMKS